MPLDGKPFGSASAAPALSLATSFTATALTPWPAHKFDGTLYYQMHLTANVLVDRCAVCTPQVLVLCRQQRGAARVA